MDNLALARVLGEIADLLEIKGENPFKIRAYRNAADTIAAEPRAWPTWPTRRLRDCRASARTSPRDPRDLSRPATRRYRQELLPHFPPTLLDLLRLQGVGPKTVSASSTSSASRRSTRSRPPRRTAASAR